MSDDAEGPVVAGHTTGTDGVEIGWRRYGSSDDPMVFAVHGFASTAALTWESSGWLRALTAAGRQVVTTDLRGHGSSDAPTDAAAYGIDTMVDDLVAVLDAVAPGPVDYLGYSLGARLGWELAVRHPSRIRSLSLGGLPASEPLVGFDLAAASASRSSGSIVADPATRAFVSMIDAVPANDPSALFALAVGVRTSPRSGAAPTVPMLLVTGENDEVARDGIRLVDRVPGARFVGIPGRTHANTLSARAFKIAVIDFLDALG
ncbi:pimeloyl-ACP methyl ester carboxylesterase [Mycetocola sp. CAN_C7]|uniref:alpha/beta fold hydrolase n=1 Tax=Mycetocola sp. CAN_C7 TaxID=2787724 RepID=UPI0018CA4D13